MAKSVIGLFANEDAGRTAWRAMERAGFSQDQASFVDRDTNRLADHLAAVGIPANETLTYVDSVKLGGVLLVLQALSDPAAECAAELLSSHGLVDTAASDEGLPSSPRPIQRHHLAARARFRAISTCTSGERR